MAKLFPWEKPCGYETPNGKIPEKPLKKKKKKLPAVRVDETGNFPTGGAKIENFYPRLCMASVPTAACQKNKREQTNKQASWLVN